MTNFIFNLLCAALLWESPASHQTSLDLAVSSRWGDAKCRIHSDKNADPEPTSLKCRSGSGSCSSSKWCLSATIGLLDLQSSIYFLHASIVSVHGSPWLQFEIWSFLILTLMRIWIQLLALMLIWIRIRFPKILRIWICFICIIRPERLNRRPNSKHISFLTVSLFVWNKPRSMMIRWQMLNSNADIMEFLVACVCPNITEILSKRKSSLNSYIINILHTSLYLYQENEGYYQDFLWNVHFWFFISFSQQAAWKRKIIFR